MQPQQVDTNAIQSPTSPLGSFPELAAMYRTSFQLPASNAGVSAQAQADQTTVSAQKAAASASNYQQVARPDGGFGFYDPNGNEISAAQYASATGKTPGDVLKNSTNPIDIGYQKDFKDLQDYINNKLQSSTNVKSAAAAKNVEQQVQKTFKVDISKYTPAQLIQQFQHAYPTVYGLQNTGVPSGQVFIPQSNI